MVQYGLDKITDTDGDGVIEADIKMSQIDFVDVSRKYKVVCIQDIGSSTSAVVLEDLRSRQVRFLRIDFAPRDGRRRLKFVQLGLQINLSELAVSPLLKYRSVSKRNPKTGGYSQLAVAIRENGRVEFFSDFVLVNEYTNPKLQCVDVLTDFRQFYLKFVMNAD